MTCYFSWRVDGINFMLMACTILIQYISINWISSTKEMNPITRKGVSKLVIQFQSSWPNTHKMADIWKKFTRQRPFSYDFVVRFLVKTKKQIVINSEVYWIWQVVTVGSLNHNVGAAGCKYKHRHAKHWELLQKKKRIKMSVNNEVEAKIVYPECTASLHLASQHRQNE